MAVALKSLHITIFSTTMGQKSSPHNRGGHGGANKTRRRDNSFCSLSKHDHSFHRRRVSTVYTKSALFGSRQLASITEKVLLERLLPKLVGYASSSQPVDLLELSYALSLDHVSCFLFGYSSGSDFLHDQGATRLWLEHYENQYCKEAFWLQELPGTTRFLDIVGISMLPSEHAPSKHYLEQWMMRMCDSAEATCSVSEKGDLEDAGDVPIVYQQVKKSVDVDSNRMDPQVRRLEVASELFDHLCM